MISQSPTLKSRNLQGLLSPRGRFYLVAVKQNNVPRVREFMSEIFSLQSEVNKQLRSHGLSPDQRS
jgi:release factor glutamine methyltransferase